MRLGFIGRAGPPDDRLCLRNTGRLFASGLPITSQLPLDTLASLGHCLQANCRLAQRSRCGVRLLHLRILDELSDGWNG